MRSLALVAVGGLVVACSGQTSPTDDSAPSDSTAAVVAADDPNSSSSEPSSDVLGAITATSQAGRVDLQPTGNRVIVGPGALGATDPVTVQLPPGRVARWLIPLDATSWFTVLDDGSVRKVTAPGGSDIVASQTAPPGTLDPADPPPILVDGSLVPASALHSIFSDPLPDTRVVTDGRDAYALGGPTDAYPHGVLGDAIEAAGVEVVRPTGSRSTPIAVGAPDVIESVSPMLADVDGNGDLDVAVTVSNSDVGARIVAFAATGETIAESEPIGTGNRWLNLLAVAPTGPDEAIEVIAVRTPHIGGVLEFFRYDGSGGLERVASADGYSTHVIGSRNLDLGIVTDADGNGSFDVVLPTQDLDHLAIVTRDPTSSSGTREIMQIPLGADITTNVAASGGIETGVAYAVGTSDGRITVWPAPTNR